MVTVVLDSNGSLALIYTPEVGAGTPGLGAFARGVGGAGTVDDVIGDGLSASGGLGGLSVSSTLPIVQDDCTGIINSGDPVHEFGIGTPGISVTAGSGQLIGRTEILGDIGGWIGRTVYDVVHWF